MPPNHQIKSSFHLGRPDKPGNKKNVELGTVENNGVLGLVMWGGAFVFGCLLIASTFKKSKKTISPKRSREGDSNLDVIGGFKESSIRDDDDKAREMEGLRLLLSSSTDSINHPRHTSSKMLTNSIENSEDENLITLTTEPILQTKEEENIVVIIYEEEEYTNSEESIENATQKYDESSKVAQRFPSTALFDEDDKNGPSSASSSSSSYSSSESSLSLSEETSSSGVLSQEIDNGDDKNIDIIICIDDDDENYHEDEHAHIYTV